MLKMPAAKLSDVQEKPVSGTSIFGKLIWTGSELLVQSEEMKRCATKFESARACQDFPGMRSAYLDLETCRDQVSHLLDGARNAIAKEQERGS